MSQRSRAKKIEWFRGNIPTGSSVLLVGASPAKDGGGIGVDNQVERGIAAFTDATALVYEPGDPMLNCPFVPGDACDLPFPDKSFDYVISNAVIEHVGGRERAAVMLSESRRVARKGAMHTTPDRWFPVETHTQIPLLHWLPRTTQDRVFARTKKPWFNHRDYWLFGRRDFSTLDDAFAVARMSRITLVTTWSEQQPAMG